MSAHSLIRLIGITKTYGHGPAAFPALRSIDLDVAEGEFLAIADADEQAHSIFERWGGAGGELPGTPALRRVIVVSGAAGKMIEEALKLPEDERAEIAGELLVSLDGSGAALGGGRRILRWPHPSITGC